MLWVKFRLIKGYKKMEMIINAGHKNCQLSTVMPEVLEDGIYKVTIPSQLDKDGRKKCGCMSKNPDDKETSVQLFEDLPSIKTWTCNTCGGLSGGFLVDNIFYTNKES